MNLPGDVSSSDLTLRHHAPRVVAEPWLATCNPLPTPLVRFHRRIAFVDVSLRYIVAVLAAEVAARNLGEPAAWKTLVKRLDSPTLGMWAMAAIELSELVANVEHPLAGGIAAALVERDPHGGVRRTDACDAVRRLTESRNDTYHDDHASDRVAETRLADTDTDFRLLLANLRSVRRHTILCAHRVEPRTDEGFDATLLALRGLVDPPPRTAWIGRAVPRGAPFLAGANGQVLLLGPLLAWDSFDARSDPELRLFKKWGPDGPLYSDPAGGEALTRPHLPMPDRASWLRGAHGGSILANVFPIGRDREYTQDPDGAAPPPEVPGYHVATRIGMGASGHVYVGRPVGDGSPSRVAIKVLARSIAADPGARERLRREYTAMKQLESQHIVRVYDYLPDAPCGPTLILEYVPGRDLHSIVTEEPLQVGASVQVCVEVLSGLKEVHRLGIIHRDIKPSNILMDAQSHSRLLDFGIARVQDNNTLTRTSDGLGTLAFAAPEQLAGSRVDPRADLYSVGRLLGFLVSGSHAAAEQGARLPGALHAVWRRATAAAPDDRYPTATAMLDALRDARERRWDGPPLEDGQLITAGKRAGALRARLDPGLWVLDGHDVEMDERIGLLVCDPTDAARSRLRAALQGLGVEGRRALGASSLNSSPDGLAWCVLTGSDPVSSARMMLTEKAPPAAAESPRPEAPTRTPPQKSPPPTSPPASPSAPAGPAPAANPAPPPSPMPVRGVDRPNNTARNAAAVTSGALALGALALGSGPLGLLAAAFGIGAAAGNGRTTAAPVPAYLAGWPALPPTASPASLAARADDLALVVIAQAAVLGAEVDIAWWSDLRRARLRPCRELLADPTDRWPAPIGPHLRNTRTRVAALQAILKLHAWLETGVYEAPDRQERKDIDLALNILSALGTATGAAVSVEALEPWITRSETGYWLRASGASDRWTALGHTP